MAKTCHRVIITGDANLCALKWNEEKYNKQNIAVHFKISIEQCGLIKINLVLKLSLKKSPKRSLQQC